jgi:hypothetical protein
LHQGLPGQLSLEKYIARISELATIKQNDDTAQYILQELQLWAESILPIDEVI